MAVAFDAVGPSSSGVSFSSHTSPVTWTHTGVGSNLAVIAIICFDEATSATVPACTYNGVAMTLIGANPANNANNGYLYFFGIANAPTGAQTISFSWTGGPTTPDIISAGSISWTGAALTFAAAFGPFQPSPLSLGQGNAANPSLSVKSTMTTSSVVCAIASGASTITSQSGGSQKFLANNGSSGDCGSIVASTAVGTGGQISFTSSITSASFAIDGVEVLPPISAATSGNARFSPSHLARYRRGRFSRLPRSPAIPAPYPKIQTLIDNFVLNDLATLWQNTIGTVTWSQGQVAIKSDTAYDSALVTNSPYDLTNSSIYIQIVPYIATSSDIQFGLYQGQFVTSNNSMFIGFGGPNNLHIFKDVNGTQTNLFNTTYNASTMGWWRIRESGGTVFFDTAPDGATWTNQFSTADSTFSFPLNAVGVSVLGGDSGSDPAGTTYLYRVNTNTGAAFTSTLNTNVALLSPAPIVRDQPATVFAAGGTTIVITWSVNPTAGSKVIVAFSTPNALTPTSVVDNSSTPINLTLDEGPGSGAQRLYIYRADNVQPTASQYKVTVSYASATGGATGWGASYLNVAAGGPTSSNSGTTTGGTSVSTGNATPAHAGALYFAAMGDTSSANPETITLTNATFTEQATQNNGSSTVAMGFADKIDNSGPTATACTWSTGDTVNLYAGIVTYDAVYYAAPKTALTRAIFRALTGTAVVTGNVTRALTRTLVALAVVTGSLARRVSRALAAAINVFTPTPTIHLIQHASGVGATSAASSATITLPQATGAGNTLIVAVSYVTNSAENTDLTSVTLGGSGTGFASQAKTNGANYPFYNISYWANYNIAGGQTSVVVSVGGAANGFDVSVDVYEVDDLVTIDKSVFNEVESTSTNWTSNATSTLSQNTEFAVGLGALYNNAGSSFTITGPSSPWTNEPQLTVNTQYSQMSGYQITSSNSALTYSGTANVTGGNLSYIAAVATFVAPASGLIRQILRSLIATIVTVVSVVVTKMSGGNHYLLTVVATIIVTPSTQRTIGRILADIVTVTGATGRSCGRGLAASIVVTGAVTRSVGRPLNAALIVIASVSRKISRPIVSVIVLTGSVVRLTSRILTSTTVIFGSVVRMCGKGLAPVVVLTSSVTRQVSRPVTATIVVTATLTRTIMRSLSAVVVLTATTVTQKFKLVVLNAAIAVTSSVSRQVSKPLAAVVVLNASVQRYILRTLVATLIVYGIVYKNVERTLSAVVDVTASVTRQTGKVLNSTVNLTGVILRSLGKLITPVITVTVSTSRFLTRTINAIVTLPVAFSAVKAKFITLTANVVTVAITSRSTGRVLTGLVVATGSTGRFCGRIINGIVVGTGSLTRGISRTVSAIIVMVASTTLVKAKNVLLTATVVTYAATTRSTQRILGATATLTANTVRYCGKGVLTGLITVTNLTRQVNRNVTTTVVLIASFSISKVKNVALTCTVAITGATTRRVLPIISAVTTIASSTTRVISRSIQGNLSVAGQTVRQVGRGCTAGLVATSQVARQIGRILTAPVAVTLVIKRFCGYIITTGISVSSSVKVTIGKVLTAVAALVSSVGGVGHNYFVTLTTGITTSASVLTRLISAGGDFIFRKGTMYFRWVIGSVGGRWRT